MKDCDKKKSSRKDRSSVKFIFMHYTFFFSPSILIGKRSTKGKNLGGCSPPASPLLVSTGLSTINGKTNTKKNIYIFLAQKARISEAFKSNVSALRYVGSANRISFRTQSLSFLRLSCVEDEKC